MDTITFKHRTGRFRIANRWLDDHYLHIENLVPEVSVISMKWQSAVWDFVPVGGTAFVRLVNKWQPECCLQILHGELECGRPLANDNGSHWYTERIKGSRFHRLRHGNSGDSYLHFEDRILQVGPISPAWWSAEWEFRRA